MEQDADYEQLQYDDKELQAAICFWVIFP